jgi:hypothetical protein
VKRALLAAVLLLSCARAPAVRDGTSGRPGSLSPPSSILAVLAHRQDLALDDGQVARLLQLQKDLEQKNAESKDLLTESPAPKSTPGTTGARPPRRSRGMGGSGGSGDAHAGPLDREEAFAEVSADNDTRTFLAAEPIFHRDQWDRARDYAEKYRIDYAEQREGLRQRDSGEPK